MSHPRSADCARRAAYINAVVGENARKARKELGLTQAQVSSMLGSGCESYYRGVESGVKQISLVRLVDIADALGVQPYQLLEGL